jgi:hypothetical protein
MKNQPFGRLLMCVFLFLLGSCTTIERMSQTVYSTLSNTSTVVPLEAGSLFVEANKLMARMGASDVLFRSEAGPTIEVKRVKGTALIVNVATFDEVKATFAVSIYVLASEDNIRLFNVTVVRSGVQTTRVGPNEATVDMAEARKLAREIRDAKNPQVYRGLGLLI